MKCFKAKPSFTITHKVQTDAVQSRMLKFIGGS